MIHSLKDEFEVGVICDVLGVSRSGYYAWACRHYRPGFRCFSQGFTGCLVKIGLSG